MTELDECQAILKRLEWSVRALVQEGAVQIRLFPTFVCVADELALEFDEWLRRAEESRHLFILTNEQETLFRDLDATLDAMSGPEHLELWEPEALYNAPEWKAVRAQARNILDKMGWPDVPPPAERDIYVGPE